MIISSLSAKILAVSYDVARDIAWKGVIVVMFYFSSTVELVMIMIDNIVHQSLTSGVISTHIKKFMGITIFISNKIINFILQCY